MRIIQVILLGIFLFSSCMEHAEPEDYYLPDDFEGVVVVLFGIKEGQEKKYIDGRRQYYVPKNGIIYSQYEEVNGILDRMFYLGKDKLHVKHFYGQEELDSNKVYVFDMMDGMFYLNIDTTASNYTIDTSTHDFVKMNYYTVGKGSTDQAELRVIGESIKSYIINAYPKKVSDVSQFYSHLNR